jgi:hypothetical protein
MLAREGGPNDVRSLIGSASKFLPPRDAQALMSKGKDLRGVCLIMSRRQQLCPRLTNEAPARVFHQGPRLRSARRLDAMRTGAVKQ